jgi:transposase
MSKRIEIPIETRQEILSLHQLAYGSRQIARRVPCSRKTVRRVLSEAGLSENSPTPQPSKLAPFLSLIEQKVRQDLTTSRILREIREAGYQGGRTILAEQVRQMRPTLGQPPRKGVKRRFETPPAQEMQIDWSPYLVPVGERTVRVHALGCLLCHSRKLFAHFFPDERQSTLLEGLAMSFEYFEGCATRVVLDNMSTAVLGRYHSDGTVLWNPRFADFARHYGFAPFACKPRDADRKGKKEKSFRLLWDDFLKGSHFASWEDLNARMRIWLDHTPETANLRVHNTTRRVPNEAWHEERSLLIALPEKRFAVYEQSVRLVDCDSTVSVHGTRYTVPATLANRAVEVRLFAEHFEVFDSHGKLAFSRRYVGEDQHGQLIIEPTHYANVPRRPGGNAERLDAAFVARYPTLAPLVRGLQLKMKSLAGVHLRALLRLADRYGSADFLAAAEHAQSYRRFDARAVGRILEQRHGPGEDPSVPPLGRCAPDLVPDGEPGDLDSYAHLDTKAKAERCEVANDHSPHPDAHPVTKDANDNEDNDDNSQEQ